MPVHSHNEQKLRKRVVLAKIPLNFNMRSCLVQGVLVPKEFLQVYKRFTKF